jgi:hypothetical protein
MPERELDALDRAALVRLVLGDQVGGELGDGDLLHPVR